MGSDDRLESWKEIASYLGREIRTVQRWEKDEKLPVRRHHHKKQGSVYAYRSELDAWLDEREVGLEENKVAGSPRRAVASLAAAAGLLGIAAVAALNWPRAEDTTAPRSGKILLVVLPLENLSDDDEQGYFADGLTEELIAQLSAINPDRLGVIAWTTSRQYREVEKTVEEIRDELGVDFIIEGRVRREDDRVRITVRLVQVGDQAQIWAETYEQELKSVLLVQREVARAVAGRIRVDLAPREETEAVRTYLNVEAYEAFLRGRQEFYRWSGPGFRKALAHFERATELDPDYAIAHAWHALCHATVAFFGFMPPHDVFPRVRESISKALAIDPRQVEARLALGVTYFAYEWRWDAAEREFLAVLDESPNSPTAHWVYAWFLTAVNRDEEARLHITRALEIDPLNPYINTGFGDMLALWDDPEAALRQYRRTLDRNPGFAWPRHLMALIHAQTGKFEDAVEEERLYLEQSGESPSELQALEAAFEASPRKGFWEWHVARLNDRGRYPLAYSAVRLAIGYAHLGDREAALEWLERAREIRAPFLVFTAVNPALAPLRDDPSFEAFVREMVFPM